MTMFWRTAVQIGSRLDRAGIAHCVIKSYGGDPKYNDGNVDMLVDRPLLEVFHAVLEKDFHVTSRDRIKNVLYERNKLMASANTADLAKIHLHRNVGWHNICFLTADQVLGHCARRTFSDGAVRVADRATEARMFVLHIIFEQFRKNEWDERFLCDRDYDDFAEQFSIPSQQIAKVRDARVGPLTFADLRPIWNRYYQQRKHETRIDVWHRFLHWGLTCVARYRGFKGSRQSP